MASAQPGKPALTGPASQSQRGSAPGLRYPSSGKTIYHRPLNRSRTQELSQASFAYLFGEMVSYAQKRVTGIQDLEKRYASRPMHPEHSLQANSNVPKGSTSKATPSASSSSTCSSTASPRAHRPGRCTSSPCSNSSPRCSGATSSPRPRTRSRSPPTQRRPTST